MDLKKGILFTPCIFIIFYIFHYFTFFRNITAGIWNANSTTFPKAKKDLGF